MNLLNITLIIVINLYFYHVFWTLGWIEGYENDKPMRLTQTSKFLMALSWPVGYVMYWTRND